jgi:hypothetical protein
MRSELVFGATKQVPNRFLLVRTLAKATRGLHKSGTRIEDATDDALIRFGCANPIAQTDPVPMAANILAHRSTPQGVNDART